MDAIIPAAGLATRMKGMPKFLLPCDDSYTSLLEYHVNSTMKFCDRIWIPTRPDLVGMLSSINLDFERIIILPMVTENMTQTVKRVDTIAKTDEYFLAMPDTFYYGEAPYDQPSDTYSGITHLYCWSIRDDQKGKLGQVLLNGEGQVIDMQDKDPDCNYTASWGALKFKSELLKYANQHEPHIGYAAKNALNAGEFVSGKVMNGKYFDCGTPTEYLDMLQEVIRNK
jgi:hypothetical protein